MKASFDSENPPIYANSILEYLKKNGEYYPYIKTKVKEKQVKIFTYQGVPRYAIKQCWKDYDSTTKDDIIKEQAEYFICENYNQYKIQEQLNLHNYTFTPKDFQITYIYSESKKSGYLVTEMLLSYDGMPLDFVELTKGSDFINEVCEIFEQVVEAANWCKHDDLENYDINPENIFIFWEKFIKAGQEEKRVRVRVMDFHIREINSYHQIKGDKGSIIGYSSKYLSPEIFQYIKETPKIERKFDAFKCMVYSIGLVILKLLGFVPLKYDNFDYEFKKDNESHTKLLKSINKFESDITESYKSSEKVYKIFKIIKLCLSNNTVERPSTVELLAIVKNIKGNNLSVNYSQSISLNKIEESQENTIELENRTDDIIDNKGNSGINVEENKKQPESLSNISIVAKKSGDNNLFVPICNSNPISTIQNAQPKSPPNEQSNEKRTNYILISKKLVASSNKNPYIRDVKSRGPKQN